MTILELPVVWHQKLASYHINILGFVLVEYSNFEVHLCLKLG